ncbi:MAG: hypothetical protein R6V04_08530 [bacterium]
MKRLVLTVLISVLTVSLFAQTINLNLPSGRNVELKKEYLVNSEDSVVMSIKNMKDTSQHFLFYKVKEDDAFCYIKQNDKLKGFTEKRGDSLYTRLWNGARLKHSFDQDAFYWLTEWLYGRLLHSKAYIKNHDLDSF